MIDWSSFQRIMLCILYNNISLGSKYNVYIVILESLQWFTNLQKCMCKDAQSEVRMLLINARTHIIVVASCLFMTTMRLRHIQPRFSRWLTWRCPGWMMEHTIKRNSRKRRMTRMTLLRCIAVRKCWDVYKVGDISVINGVIALMNGLING